MKTNKIKNIRFIPFDPIDINNDFSDVLITLEDNTEYLLEFTTPMALVTYMKDRNFLEPLSPFIIVRELTPHVIKEAIEAFLTEEENEYWFKLYYGIRYATIDELNLMINRHKKEMEAEELEDAEEVD